MEFFRPDLSVMGIKDMGGNMIDSTGWYGEPEISNRLHEDLVDWSVRFENWACSGPIESFRSFNWERFHKRGLLFAKRLKKEVEDKAIARYIKPYEDPTHGEEEIVIIENDA